MPSNYSNLFFFALTAKFEPPLAAQCRVLTEMEALIGESKFYMTFYISSTFHILMFLCGLWTVWRYTAYVFYKMFGKNSCTKKRTQHLWASWQFEPLNIMYWNWNFNLISFFVHSTCTILLRYCFSGLSDILSRQCFVSQRRDRRLRAKNLN